VTDTGDVVSSCFSGGEALRNGGFGGIVCVFVCNDLLPQRRLVWDAAIQILPTQQTQLHFGHTQPTAVFRSVMKLQLLQQASGLREGKGLIERRRLAAR
jgi:hypothetical protein